MWTTFAVFAIVDGKCSTARIPYFLVHSCLRGRFEPHSSLSLRLRATTRTFSAVKSLSTRAVRVIRGIRALSTVTEILLHHATFPHCMQQFERSLLLRCSLFSRCNSSARNGQSWDGHQLSGKRSYLRIPFFIHTSVHFYHSLFYIDFAVWTLACRLRQGSTIQRDWFQSTARRWNWRRRFSTTLILLHSNVLSNLHGHYSLSRCRTLRSLLFRTVNLLPLVRPPSTRGRFRGRFWTLVYFGYLVDLRICHADVLVL